MTTDDVKARLAAALGGDGPLAALAALGRAAEWAADALAQDAAQGAAQDAADDVAAFQTVVALDDALERLAAVERAVPALLEAAAPGRPVRDHLRARYAEVAAARARLAEARAAHAELAGAERELAELAAEHERLRDRVAELRRLRRLADEVAELRVQAEAFAARAERVRAGEAGDAEREAGEAAGELVRLTGEQLALLEPRVREAVAAAGRADAELAELRARLDGADERIAVSRAELAAAAEGFEALRARHEEVLAPLRAYRRANVELAAGLAAALNDGAPSLVKEPGLERAERELADIETRLEAIDEVIGRVLADHADTHERARATLGWTG